jgi:hypothetical protein|tara:strand:- start:3525 stop:3926 length:402 start_codon:yes stop_codon:yes gene_type:complete
MTTEQIKDLLKEIMKTKDPELIQMATEILKSESTEKKQPSANTDQKEFEFTMKSDTELSSIGGTPVDKTARVNTFVDDGTESVDITTPSFTPTERKRTPYKPIEQTCVRCNRSEMVNPTHARENYNCSKCLGR